MWNKLKETWQIANKLNAFSSELASKLITTYECKHTPLSYILISNIELQEFRNRHYLSNHINLSDKQWNSIITGALNHLTNRCHVTPYSFVWCDEGLIMIRKSK